MRSKGPRRDKNFRIYMTRKRSFKSNKKPKLKLIKKEKLKSSFGKTKRGKENRNSNK